VAINELIATIRSALRGCGDPLPKCRTAVLFAYQRALRVLFEVEILGLLDGDADQEDQRAYLS